MFYQLRKENTMARVRTISRKKLDCLSTQQEAVYALFRHFFKVVFNTLIFCFGLDVNECANNPCKNGAKCTNTRGSYTCTCDSRFTGKNCDQGK